MAIVEIEVKEVSLLEEAGENSKSNEQQAKEAQKRERKVARWRTQPSNADLGSQESCVVS